MRTSELASLAGVTVRTLRHYHAIGLMPEPPRRSNGYREYRAEDLLRLLRIRQLVALGFSLDEVDGMLDELDAERDARSDVANVARVSADEQLRSLDIALARQIARLQEQRNLIARLRSRELAAVFPERAAGALAAMGRVRDLASGAGFLEQALSDADQLGLGIAAHLYTDAELSEIERVFNAIADRGLTESYRRASTCLDAIGPGSSPAEQDRAVKTCLAFLGQIEDCFDPQNWLRDDTPCERVLDQEATASFNSIQKAVSDRVFDELCRRLAARAQQTDGAPRS